MSPDKAGLMVVAGEPSGDIHAAHLLRAISREAPGVRFFGMGGEAMRAAGAEILHEYGPLAVVGFGGILGILPALFRIKRDLIDRVRSERPEAVILVDYPGFNLSLAKSIKKLPHPPRLIYFIPPQVWAWRTGRAHTIAEVFDLILTIYPFEPEYFRRPGGNAEFIGNPVAFGLRGAPSRAEARASLGIGAAVRVAAFLPGSRRREIDRLLPPMIESAKILQRKNPEMLFLVSEAEALPEGTVRSRMPPGGGFVRIVRGRAHEVIRAADAAAVASGTATLETGLLGTPLSVLYASDFFTHLIVKYFLIQVDYISLVNLLAGKEVAPELYQGQVRGGKIADALAPLLDDPGARERQTREFDRIRESLDAADPYERAASLIRRLLDAAR
jgi:lipid-A-disaccharide synthase